MDKLQAMTTFVRVVQAQSFSKAAATLALPRSSVTTTIKQLEALLGTPLLRRTTRSLSLTEAGAHYYAACQAILAQIAEPSMPWPPTRRHHAAGCGWTCRAPSAAPWWCRACASSRRAIRISSWCWA